MNRCDTCYAGRHAACRDGDYVTETADPRSPETGWCCCGHLKGWSLPT